MFRLLPESALILGIIVILILFFYGIKNNRNNLLLALSVAVIWLSLGINHLNETGQILTYPALIRTGNIFAYLIFPALFIFSRNTFYPGNHWYATDWLFLVPSLIYIADMLPFFLSDADYKIAVMKANLGNPARMFNVAEGWIGFKGFHFVFRYLWSVFIFVLQIRLIIKNRQIRINSPDAGNRKLFWFILMYTAFQIPLIVPGIFGAILHLKWYTLHFVNQNLALSILSLAIFILFSPSVLYGFLPRPLFATIADVDNPLKDNEPEQETVVSNATEKIYLDSTEMADMIARIEAHIQQNKPFLNPRYSIHDLANETKIPVYQLSPIINQHFATNFNNWLNGYRVQQFVELCEETKNFGLTIDALALDAGFSNRATLTAAFKKEKNQTPGLYLKQHRIA